MARLARVGCSAGSPLAPSSLCRGLASFEERSRPERGEELGFGSTGTRFDHHADGGQNNLYLFLRAEAAEVFAQRHAVSLVCEPIDVRTEATLRKPFQVYEPILGATGLRRWRPREAEPAARA